jgi:hypothetical protein
LGGLGEVESKRTRLGLDSFYKFCFWGGGEYFFPNIIAFQKKTFRNPAVLPKRRVFLNISDDGQCPQK